MNNPDIAVSRDLQKLAEMIDKRLYRVAGERVGFCLVTFPLVEDSRASYISNCDRVQVIDALEELLERWAQGMPDVPAHDYQS